MRGQAEGMHVDLKAALEHLLEAGGKRVRPKLSLLVGTMLGVDIDRLVTLASAIELLHTATLVHDDLLDGALLRRGIATLNSNWSPAATILTGDFVFARAAQLAAETNSVSVMGLFGRTLSIIVNGEITQMFDGKGLISRENYFERIYAKTASMFELATMAPVYLSDGDQEKMDAMQRYGYEVGIAFQIMDDILDFTSDESSLGKPVASDLRNGLVTLPALCYLESNPEDLQINAVLNGGLSDAKVETLVESIRSSGAIEQALAEARSYVARGLQALEIMPDGTQKQSLEEFANYVIDRSL